MYFVFLDFPLQRFKPSKENFLVFVDIHQFNQQNLQEIIIVLSLILNVF
jgi:hypothetical protein